MKLGTHTTLRWSTKDRRLMTELMDFWKRTDKEIMRLAFDQLVLATQQIQQRLIDEENNNEETTTDGSDRSSTTGLGESYCERSLESRSDGSEITESDADGAVPTDRTADAANEAQEQRGAE